MDSTDLRAGVTISSTEELGQLLKQHRKSQQITQATLSGMANWGGRFIGDVENGKPTVRAQMLFDLIGWLGLEIVIRKKGPK
ncbi:helix-turn-helix domain-containing protein [Polaromonas glacialis]|uniref:helix-turn-helix domain-containing protein n=1 Tax=Polaromonas glacialis TaxID=866564 RepID=UPI000495344C|nr:helix-turn-helix domain-containing protein [Polaromonas glacialis]